MTSQGFRACKQALWSAFQAHARAEESTLPGRGGAEDVESSSRTLRCLCLSRHAFETALDAFVQTPQVVTYFPYEDPLVVRGALARLAGDAPVRNQLWTQMQTSAMAAEAAVYGEDEELDAGGFETRRDARMTITLPFEVHKDFARVQVERSAERLVAEGAERGINWTCFHCTLLVFLNDSLRCHVEPAALCRCRHALAPEAMDTDVQSPPARASRGLVCSTFGGIGTDTTPSRSPRAMRQASLDKELRCMMAANSLPRCASQDTDSRAPEDFHAAERRWPSSIPVCSSSTEDEPRSASHDRAPPTGLRHANNNSNSTAPREQSPPARVIEAAEQTQFRLRLQLSNQGLCGARGEHAESQNEKAFGVLEGSSDVPSPSPIHSCDRRATLVGDSQPQAVSVALSGGGPAHCEVRTSPSPSSVCGRSTIEINVNLDEEDEDSTDAVSDGMTPPCGAVPEPLPQRSSPPRRPAPAAARAVSSPWQQQPPRTGLQTRSRSRSNRIDGKPAHASEGKAKTNARRAPHTVAEATGHRPVHCIRTRGGAATVSVDQNKVAVRGEQLDAAVAEEEKEEEEGRRTTATRLDVLTVDRGATADNAPHRVVTPSGPAPAAFDPVLKPPAEAAMEAASAGLTREVPTPARPAQPTPSPHVASAPSPSPTPCERDDDISHGWHVHAGAGADQRRPQSTAQNVPGAHPSPTALAHRTPRRGQLPEPHRAPRCDVNPCYSGLSPMVVRHVPAGVASPPVVGVPFALRSAPHTPRGSGTAVGTGVPAAAKSPSTSASQSSRPSEATSGTGTVPPPSRRAFSTAAGVVPSSSAVGTASSPARQQTTHHTPRGKTASSTCSPPPPPPPPRPPSRERQHHHRHANGSRSGDRESRRGSIGSAPPAVPRSRPSSRSGGGSLGPRRSSQSSVGSDWVGATSLPPRTPSRRASPFFRTASQTSPPTPPQYRPTSPESRGACADGVSSSGAAARRREPFYESTVAPRGRHVESGERFARMQSAPDIPRHRAPVS